MYLIAHAVHAHAVNKNTPNSLNNNKFLRIMRKMHLIAHAIQTHENTRKLS